MEDNKNVVNLNPPVVEINNNDDERIRLVEKMKEENKRVSDWAKELLNDLDKLKIEITEEKKRNIQKKKSNLNNITAYSTMLFLLLLTILVHINWRVFSPHT